MSDVEDAGVKMLSRVVPGRLGGLGHPEDRPASYI